MTNHSTWAPRRGPSSAVRTLNRAAAIVRQLTGGVAPQSQRRATVVVVPQAPRLPEWAKHCRVICKAPVLITPLPLGYAGIRKLNSGFYAAVYALPGLGIEAWIVPAHDDPGRPFVAKCVGGVHRDDFIVIR